MFPECLSFAQSLKVDCRLIGVAPKNVALPAYGQHWAFSTAIEAMAAYQQWVSCIVLPIVFQWVEEHHDKVYAKVPKELRDDIDTVVKAAFEIVREKPAYEEGQQRLADFQAKMASGKFDIHRINPTWTEISSRIRAEMREASMHESEPLVGAGR